MFEQSILKGAAKTRRAWTVVVSFGAQIVLLGLAILIPLVAFDRIPMARLSSPVVEPPLPARPQPPAKPKSMEIVGVVRIKDHRPFTAPPAINKGVIPVVDEPAPPIPVAQNRNDEGIPGGIDPARGLGQGSSRRPFWQLNPPQLPQRPREVTPVAKPVESTNAPVRMISTIMQARLIHQVKPPYPELAIRSRIEGTVHLQAVIGRDGRIQQLEALSGHPLLVPAAMNAVKEWIYQPTLLNGTPVDVITTIDVIFKLSH